MKAFAPAFRPFARFLQLLFVVGLGLPRASLARSAAAPAPGQLATLNGVTLWYEVRGSGAWLPLVVVNGGPGISHDYLLVSTVWDSLALHRRVLFYDQRGTGRSGALAKGRSCTLADQVADLEALRVRLGFARMDVLGHSWGGLLAMAYAARHPDRIGHLIICDSAAPKFDDTKFLFREVFPEVSARQDAVQFAEQFGDTAAIATDLREYMSMLAVDPERRIAMRDGELPQLNRAVNAAIIADLHAIDVGPELGKFMFPTLVLTGRFDMNVAPVVAWKIHEAVPGSQFTAFERSGHLPFLEEPAAFIARVEQFLATPAGSQR
jgi:proline iminopeptidase